MNDYVDKTLKHYHKTGMKDAASGKDPKHMLEHAYPAIGQNSKRMYLEGHRAYKEHELPYWDKK